MKRAWNAAGDWARGLLHAGLLRGASLIVPGAQRAEWRREWRGELWHVRRVCTPANRASAHNSADVTAFCLGAFQDALCVRRSGQECASRLNRLEGTPTLCLLTLAFALAASYGVAHLLPGVRAERSMAFSVRESPHAFLIQRAGSDMSLMPTISPDEFRIWSGRWQAYFDGMAFYKVTRETAIRRPAAGETQAPWNVARGTSNLLTLLGLPIQFTDGVAPGGEPEVVLSERTWKRKFGANPHVAGMELRLGAQTVRIAGVAPDGSLGLPGKVDAWLLDSRYPGDEITGNGYAIGHLKAAGEPMQWVRLTPITALGQNESEEDLLGVTLEDLRPDLTSLYLFALAIALLALPAITTVTLGEYSLSPRQTSWSSKLNRWIFFCAKTGLLLPTIYFVSIDLAYSSPAIEPETGIYIQLMATFVSCLFGLRWVLKDQRQRCPVCIRCVAHPAQVGQASRTFLDWNGTEMMCMGGHALLHVPSLPTSWFSSQRWLYLDTSWDFLFAGSTPRLP
jgi:hypothetical protein